MLMRLAFVYLLSNMLEIVVKAALPSVVEVMTLYISNKGEARFHDMKDVIVL